MRLPIVTIIGTILLLAQSLSAGAATVVAEVNLTTQTMTLTHRETVIGVWKVSTARHGKITPTGSWTAKWLSKNHRSSRYNNAPMPYSVFYNGNYAVHGTNQIGKLGRPASAGCIRLHPRNAAVLFGLAQREGLKNVRILVHR